MRRCALGTYQPLFIVFTLGFVGVAFYRLYVAPRRCAPGDDCALPAALRWQRLVFWITLALIAAMFIRPIYAPLFY